MRCFEASEDLHIVILGEDHDDHDVWALTSDTIELIGTFKKSALKRFHELMLMKRIKLVAKDFEFLQDHYARIDMEVRRVSMRLIEGSYNYVEFCTHCNRYLMDPIELCEQKECLKNIRRPDEIRRVLKLPWPKLQPQPHSRSQRHSD